MARSKTLSASVPEGIYERTREIVRREKRKQSAVVADALRLYSSLTPAARRVMEELEEQYGPRATEKLESELSRALLRARWEILVDETATRLSEELARASDRTLEEVVDEEVTAARRERRGRARP